MSNLLILGNGFDIAHGLDTKYSDFKKYLFKRATGEEGSKESRIANPRLPDGHIHTRYGKVCNIEKDCGYVFALIDEAANEGSQLDIEWNKYEEILGKLDYKKALEDNLYDKEVYMGIRDSLETLENIFFEWIRSITIGDVSKKKFLESFINPKKDLVVNFNYTETAEVVYGIEEINSCYIHGKRDKNTKYHMTSFGAGNRRLIVGYDGSNYDPHKKNLKSEDSDEYSMLVTLDTRMIKPTEDILYDNRGYFNRIRETDIQNILSFGFSFSDVDKPQIEAICEALNRDKDATKEMIWYLNSYDNVLDEDGGLENRRSKNERFKEYIRQCGFFGKFKIYNSDEVYAVE